MRAGAIRFEDFGEGGGGRPSTRAREIEAAVARARGEAQAAGYAEGYAAATAAAEAADRAAVIDLRESVQDLELSQQAARAEAIANLRPVIEALARVAAPQAAAAGFDAMLAEAVAARLAGAAAPHLVVRAAPERVEGLTLRLGEAVAVHPDPSLEGARARLEWEGGGAECDVEGCLAAARAAIGEFFGEAGEGMRDVG